MAKTFVEVKIGDLHQSIRVDEISLFREVDYPGSVNLYGTSWGAHRCTEITLKTTGKSYTLRGIDYEDFRKKLEG